MPAEKPRSRRRESREAAGLRAGDKIVSIVGGPLCTENAGQFCGDQIRARQGDVVLYVRRGTAA